MSRTAPHLKAVESMASSSGFFGSVNRHEPKSAPATDRPACSIWLQRISTLPNRSGLKTTAVRIEISVRVYGSMLSEPQDEIDPRLGDAIDRMMEKLSNDFELSSGATVDLLGLSGAPMDAQAGYLSIDGHMFRVMTLTVPLIVNDLYTQTE